MAAGLNIPAGSIFGIPSVIRAYDSNVTLANGDLVNLQASKLEIADAGEAVQGVILQAATSATLGALVNITPGLMVVMDSSSTGIVSTDGGKYFDLSGGTGAQVIDITTRDTTYTAAGTQKVFMCEKVNPQGFGYNSTATVGLYVVVKHQALR